MRHFSAYELNILLSHNIDPKTISNLNIPVEYIVKEAEFCERNFVVNESTLIPRVETEYLIELGLKYVKTQMVRFTDVGCGSGAIGLTFGIQLNLRNTLFECSLSDISDEALKVANQNYQLFKSLMGNNKVCIFNSNLLKGYSKENKLNIIFANLPYIPSSRISILDKSVKDFEPLNALDGGKDGLKFIRELLLNAKEYLSQDGVILLEVDDTHKDTKEFEKEWNIEVKNDFNGKIRYWVCHVK